ncbi:MAG: ion transporter [Lachnospiraceae bacterium]|nr:ion transporter [Lachnospiraceae bacterium]
MKSSEMMKKRVYEIIEVSKKGDIASRFYDAMMLIAVILGLLPLTMKSENKYTIILDFVVAGIFLADYCLRIYTSDYKMGIKCYQAYLAYAFTPMAIVDLLAIVPVISFAIADPTISSVLKLFRVVVVLKLIRYSKTMVIITNVLRRVKRQLGAVLMITIIYIIASAMFIFQLEMDLFKNFFEALYWATISITTIGYGDISPTTEIGRFVTMISSLVGVAVIALPSGIITAGYMEEIKKKKTAHEI